MVKLTVRSKKSPIRKTKYPSGGPKTTFKNVSNVEPKKSDTELQRIRRERYKQEEYKQKRAILGITHVKEIFRKPKPIRDPVETK